MRIQVICIVMMLPLAAVAGNIENTQHLELSVKDVATLQITCGSGFLEVYGVDGYDRIKVTATAKISGITQNMLQDFLGKHMLLSLEKRHGKAVLQSEFKNKNLMKADAKIDLTVAVPKNLRVQIDDGSGQIDVSDLKANLEIEDGSGSIQIRMITGNVTVSDSSGKIELTDVIGNLEVKDGSGKINLARVRGNVRVIDGSGPISIKDIDGNLTITDGSGSIEITDVTQNVFIKEAGSGSLEIEGVKGKVTTWGYGNQ